MRNNVSCPLLLALLMVLITNVAGAWVYPEHRYIALRAIQGLSPEYRARLDKLWQEARMGYEGRLTAEVMDTLQTIHPRQLDYASWSAIAGDHSCSPEALLKDVLHAEWIMRVADITAQLKIEMAKAKTKSQTINAIRDSDIQLQRADEEYATRASSSNVHFLLARPTAYTNAKTYLAACYAGGAELNAIGAYSWFHMSALNKASRYANGSFTETEKSALVLSALADEAFAWHFLQDVFAAGHAAGTWGVTSIRKGTHDYYNEKGLEVVTWKGDRLILMGDGYMLPENAVAAAESVRTSLLQFLNVCSGQYKMEHHGGGVASAGNEESLNVCTTSNMPAHTVHINLLEEVFLMTPVPGMATGRGEMPRFRAELGMFMGVTSSLNAYGISGGFGLAQTEGGAVAGLEANVRIGLGLDGVLNQAGDGLVFLEFGWKQDGPSTNQFLNSDGSFSSTSFTAAIPGRSAYNLRMRVPFYLIPGDLLIAAPIVGLISPKTLTKMGVVAANGGLVPWQSGIATPIGRFQFVIGREVGVSLYGRNSPRTTILVPNATNTSTYLLEFRSTQINFPILEYRPFRTFSLNQSSSLIIQLTAGLDIPNKATVLVPVGEAVPDLKSVWSFGTRITFNWRHYL